MPARTQSSKSKQIAKFYVICLIYVFPRPLKKLMRSITLSVARLLGTLLFWTTFLSGKIRIVHSSRISAHRFNRFDKRVFRCASVVVVVNSEVFSCRQLRTENAKSSPSHTTIREALCKRTQPLLITYRCSLKITIY